MIKSKLGNFNSGCIKCCKLMLFLASTENSYRIIWHEVSFKYNINVNDSKLLLYMYSIDWNVCIELRCISWQIQRKWCAREMKPPKRYTVSMWFLSFSFLFSVSVHVCVYNTKYANIFETNLFKFIYIHLNIKCAPNE